VKSNKIALYTEKGILFGYQDFYLYMVYFKVIKKIYVIPYMVFYKEYSDTADKKPATLRYPPIRGPKI
jgi:hypothetical protein